jgi:hypothetical protein
MATRAKSPPAAAPAQSTPPTPLLAGGSLGPSLGSRPLVLRPGRGAFTWMVNPAKLGCYHGTIVPLCAIAWHAAGLSANVRGDNGQGYRMQLEREGYKSIPHNYAHDAVAFGSDRSNVTHSTYLNRWEGIDIQGRPAVRWTHAWTRPQQLGHRVEWLKDDPGRVAFLHRALIEIANDGQDLSDLQIRIATESLIRRIEAESINESGHARKVIRECAIHLPREYHTEHVTSILARLNITLPAAE